MGTTSKKLEGIHIIPVQNVCFLERKIDLSPKD